MIIKRADLANLADGTDPDPDGQIESFAPGVLKENPAGGDEWPIHQLASDPTFSASLPFVHGQALLEEAEQARRKLRR